MKETHKAPTLHLWPDRSLSTEPVPQPAPQPSVFGRGRIAGYIVGLTGFNYGANAAAWHHAGLPWLAEALGAAAVTTVIAKRVADGLTKRAAERAMREQIDGLQQVYAQAATQARPVSESARRGPCPAFRR